MNYRTILLASAAVLLAGSASAADITNPFYLPSQGKVTSDTKIGYERLKLEHKNGTAENFRATEEINYGVTDNLSVRAVLGNNFDTKGLTNQQYNNDHNFDYTIGARYNMTSGNILSQIGFDYYTMDPKSWEGHRYNDSRWYKEASLNGMLGYDMGNGLMPYTSLELSSPIDQNHRPINGSVFAGAHKFTGGASFDGGIRYDFGKDDIKGTNNNVNLWFAQAEANYFLKDNMAVGVYGSYYLGGSYNEDIDYGYDAGARFKVLF